MYFSPLPPAYAPEEYEPLIPAEGMRAHLVHRENCALLLQVATDGYPAAREMDLVTLCRNASRFPRIVSEDIRFGSGGLYCHDLYFRYLVPRRKASLPGGMAEEVLRGSFGSVDSFFYRFRMTAAETRLNGFLFASVRQRNGRWQMMLSVTEGYRLPQRQYGIPVFALDLWEHAYMTAWRENRSGYADAYLRQLDWDAVSAFLLEASEGKHRY